MGMLFDLQGRRKSAIKVIYLGLAILMGGGLVLFGIGSNVSGGLADYITGGNNTVDSKEYQKRVAAAEAKVKASPKNTKAYEELIRSRYQLSGSGENFNQETFEFSEQGKAILTEMTEDWDSYVKVVDEPDPQLAALVVQAFINLEDARGAAKAQRIIAASRNEAADYLALFQYSLSAGDELTTSLSAKKAVKLSDPDDRTQVKNQIRDLRKRYEKLRQEQINEQIQEQVNTQMNPSNPLQGLGAPSPSGGQ